MGKQPVSAWLQLSDQLRSMGFDQLSDEDIVKKLRQAKSQLEHAQESLRLSELEGSLSKWQDQLCAIETKLNEAPAEVPWKQSVKTDVPHGPRHPMTPLAQHKKTTVVPVSQPVVQALSGHPRTMSQAMPASGDHLQTAGEQLQSDTVQQLFHQIDADGDDQISLPEFRVWVQPKPQVEFVSRRASLPDVPLSPFITRPDFQSDTAIAASQPKVLDPQDEQQDEQLQYTVSQIDDLLQNEQLEWENSHQDSAGAQSYGVSEPVSYSPEQATIMPSPQQVEEIGAKLDQTLAMLLNSRQQYSSALGKIQPRPPHQSSLSPVPASPTEDPSPWTNNNSQHYTTKGNSTRRQPEQRARSQSRSNTPPHSTQQLGQLLREGTGGYHTEGTGGYQADFSEPIDSHSALNTPTNAADKTVQLQVTPEEAAELLALRDHRRRDPSLKPTRSRSPSSRTSNSRTPSSGPRATRIVDGSNDNNKKKNRIRAQKPRALSTYSHLLSKGKHSTTLKWEMELRSADASKVGNKWRN